MANWNTIDYFNYIKHPRAKLIEVFWKGTPVADMTPSISGQIIDGRMVEYSTWDELPGSQTRSVGGSYTESKTIKGKYHTEQLMIRGNKWINDQYITTSGSGSTLFTKDRDMIIAGMGQDINTAMITGTKTATTWQGIDKIAIKNGIVATNATAITDQASAWTFYEGLRTLCYQLETVDVIWTGYVGFQVIRLAQRYMGTLNIAIESDTLGNDVAKIVLNEKTIPIKWAGKTRNRTSEVIAESGSTIAFYPVNYSETGLAYAFDGNFNVKEIQTSTGTEYTIEIYDLLVAHSKYSCGKYTMNSTLP